jgi:hypothetical protein
MAFYTTPLPIRINTPAINQDFPCLDRPNQESMVRMGLIYNQVASDARQRASPVDRGPIGDSAGLKQAY